jgi:hypothetical protein
LSEEFSAGVVVVDPDSRVFSPARVEVPSPDDDEPFGDNRCLRDDPELLPDWVRFRARFHQGSFADES